MECLCLALLSRSRVIVSSQRFRPRPSRCCVVFISLLFIASIGPTSNRFFSRDNAPFKPQDAALCVKTRVGPRSPGVAITSARPRRKTRYERRSDTKEEFGEFHEADSSCSKNYGL